MTSRSISAAQKFRLINRYFLFPSLRTGFFSPWHRLNENRDDVELNGRPEPYVHINME